MGGNFDWTGIGASLGDVGRELGQYQQEVLARRERERILAEQKAEREEEKAYRRSREEREERRRQAALRYEAARRRLDLVKHLPPGHPEREAAIAEYEAAAREYYETPTFTVPRKTIEVSPPVTAPAHRTTLPDGRVVVTREPKEGEPPIVVKPAETKEVYDIGGPAPEAPQTPSPEVIIGRSNALIRNIVGARSPEERRLAVDAYKQWAGYVRSTWPQLGGYLQDPEDVARRLEAEDRQAEAARAAASGVENWRRELAAARARLDSAMRGQNLQALSMAIADWNALIATGKQAGYVRSGAIDPSAAIRRWQAQLPGQVAARYSVITGVPLTTAQKSELELLRSRRLRRGGGGGSRPAGSLGPPL